MRERNSDNVIIFPCLSFSEIRFSDYHFMTVDIKKYQAEYTLVLSGEADQFLKDFKSGERTEEQLVEDMGHILDSRQSKSSPRISNSDHWKLWIGVFFLVTESASCEQVDMFNALYEFFIMGSPLARGGIPALISTGKNVIHLISTP